MSDLETPPEQSPETPGGEQQGEPQEEYGPDLAREDAADFLEGLLEAMEVRADVTVEIVDGGVEASIEGEDAPGLVGRRGETVDAIEELLRTAVRREAQARIPIALDVDGHRVRRRTELEQEARQMADRALEEGEVELEPMPAFERKIIHQALSEVPGVSTFSEGEDPRRRVIIVRESEDASSEG